MWLIPVVAGRGEPGNVFLMHALAVRPGLVHCRRHVDRVPGHNCVRHQVQAPRLAGELLASNAHPKTKDKVRAFEERGGGCRATYFNHVRKLMNGGARERQENG